MKRIIVLLCLVYSANSFSQTNIYKDLIGGRYIDSIGNANINHLIIKDSSHFIIHGERSYFIYTYKVDTLNHLLLTKEFKKFNYKFMGWEIFKSEKIIKIISKEVLIDMDSNETYKRIN